jgi:hypothetical protein
MNADALARSLRDAVEARFPMLIRSDHPDNRAADRAAWLESAHEWVGQGDWGDPLSVFPLDEIVEAWLTDVHESQYDDIHAND